MSSLYVQEHKQASIWHDLSTDWQEIYRGDHRAVLTVGRSSFLPSLIEQDEREIITPNISNTTVAAAVNVDMCGFTRLVIHKIHL